MAVYGFLVFSTILFDRLCKWGGFVIVMRLSSSILAPKFSTSLARLRNTSSQLLSCCFVFDLTATSMSYCLERNIWRKNQKDFFQQANLSTGTISENLCGLIINEFFLLFDYQDSWLLLNLIPWDHFWNHKKFTDFSPTWSNFFFKKFAYSSWIFFIL